jgi:hypothetical protein
MALQTPATLKGYFNTGDKPTEANFIDLIDSSVYTVNSGEVTLDTDTKTLIPAIAIPAGSLITNYFIVVTTQITLSSGTIGHQIGTAADGEELSAAVANSLSTAVTSLAVGHGAAVDAAMSTALSGNSAIVPVVGTTYRSAATDVHFTLDFGDSVTAGKVICGVQFVKLT